MIPALVPNPIRARIKQIEDLLELIITEKSLKLKEDAPSAIKKKKTIRHAVPRWVSDMYSQPDLLVPSFSPSNITRKKEVKDISSQDSRNNIAFFVQTTKTMLITKRLKKSEIAPILR